MFDPHKVKLPMLEGLTTEDFRRESPGTKCKLIEEINASVRKVHYEDFMQRNPGAYPNDVLMDWGKIVGIDKIVPADELVRRMADVAIIVPVSESSPDHGSSQENPK